MNPLHLFHITNDRIMQDITNGRCGWCGTDELYVKYHDQEWGKLVTDDKTLFEFLVLESAQAGLSWITILRKREGYRKAFCNFDAELVAQMTDEDVERLMQFEGIVKNRLKIKSTITNAKLFLAVQKEFGSFYNYTLSFFPDKKPIINTFRSLSEIPVSSPESDAMSKDMKNEVSSSSELRFATPICKLQVLSTIIDRLYLPESSTTELLTLLTLSSPFIGNLNMSFPPFLFEKNSNDMTAGIEFKTIRVSVIQ